MCQSGENEATDIEKEALVADEGEELDDEVNISETVDEQIPPATLEKAENLIAGGFKHYSLFDSYCRSWNRICMTHLPPLKPFPSLCYSLIDQKLTEHQIGDGKAPDVIKKNFKMGSESIQTYAALTGNMSIALIRKWRERLSQLIQYHVRTLHHHLETSTTIGVNYRWADDRKGLQ
ncbi:hypothetical protein Aperf_G00000005354 [Anoplocephala perfoliata]